MSVRRWKAGSVIYEMEIMKPVVPYMQAMSKDVKNAYTYALLAPFSSSYYWGVRTTIINHTGHWPPSHSLPDIAADWLRTMRLAHETHKVLACNNSSHHNRPTGVDWRFGLLANTQVIDKEDGIALCPFCFELPKSVVLPPRMQQLYRPMECKHD